MSVKREIRDYLNDIEESVEDIRSFIKGLSFDDFVADKKTSNAVVRSLEPHKRAHSPLRAVAVAAMARRRLAAGLASVFITLTYLRMFRTGP